MIVMHQKQTFKNYQNGHLKNLRNKQTKENSPKGLNNL